MSLVGPNADVAACRGHVRFTPRRGRSQKPVKVCICGQDTIVGISQGWKLSGVIKTAERKLADSTGSRRRGPDGLGGEQRAYGAKRQRHHHYLSGIRATDTDLGS
jgi:hypothetical protein